MDLNGPSLKEVEVGQFGVRLLGRDNGEAANIRELFKSDPKVLLVSIMIAVKDTNKRLMSIEQNLSAINRKQLELETILRLDTL